VAVGIFASPPIYAAGGKPGFSLQPAVYDPENPVTRSYFVLNLRPGTTTTLSIRVLNSGTAAGTVNLYPEDAATAQTGGTVFNAHGAPLRDVGAWISLKTSSLTLAAGQSEIVPFTLTTPRTARSGQHIGGIIAESISKEAAATKNQHFQINVEHSFGLAVQVNLPGPANEQLTATGIQAGGANNYQNLQVTLHNTGNMMVKGKGSLRIIDTNDALVQNLSIDLGTFLPATSINYPINVQKKALGPGGYQGILDLTYGHDRTLHYTTRFTITQQQVAQVFQPAGALQAPESAGIFSTMPWWQIILIGLLGLGGVAFLGQNVYRFAVATRRKSKNGKRK